MKYHELQAAANKQDTRVGRGIAAGKGKTAGRGTKGQNSRKSGGVRLGFEGGQNPLHKSTPKLPGFRSIRVPAENIFTGQLDAVGANIDNFTLFNAGLVSSPHVRVKLIVKGDVTKKVKVSVQLASESAIAAVQKAGGSFVKTPQVKRQAKAKDEK